MKKISFGLLFLFTTISYAQREKIKKYYEFDANYFYGSIIEHSVDIEHLITGHPEGIILGFSRKTYGEEAWQRRYNYPDFGWSFTYQDLKNPALGKNYGLYAHFNFYVLNRNLMLRIGQGIAFAGKPYNQETNYLNNAYGFHLLSSTYLMANFKKENIFKGLGIQAGVSVIHYSDADFHSPNSSTNTFTFNAGINYLLEHQNIPAYVQKDPNEKRYTEPIHFNFVVRSGVNTMGIANSRQFPFLTVSVIADKVINKKSTLQAGTELFFSRAMEEFINYQAIAFPQGKTTGDEDAKRVGIFIGHQLTLNKLSVITQLGFYAYYPYNNYVERVYNRLGLQRKISEHWWASATVRSHAANAEAVEFSVGYRL